MVNLRISDFQVVTSIISSGLIVFAITTFYSDFINKPDIHINPLIDGNWSSIELRNNGMAPATHVLLTLEVPAENIIQRIFTTENWTVVRNDTQQLTIP
jgi:hypothetical protein